MLTPPPLLLVALIPIYSFPESLRLAWAASLSPEVGVVGGDPRRLRPGLSWVSVFSLQSWRGRRRGHITPVSSSPDPASVLCSYRHPAPVTGHLSEQTPSYLEDALPFNEMFIFYGKCLKDLFVNLCRTLHKRKLKDKSRTHYKFYDFWMEVGLCVATAFIPPS